MSSIAWYLLYKQPGDDKGQQKRPFPFVFLLVFLEDEIKQHGEQKQRRIGRDHEAVHVEDEQARHHHDEPFGLDAVFFDDPPQHIKRYGAGYHRHQPHAKLVVKDAVADADKHGHHGRMIKITPV